MAWIDYYLTDKQYPKKDLLPWETKMFLVLALVNAMCELIIAVLFFSLWIFFNRLIKDPHQKVQVRHRCIFNSLMALILILYLSSVIVFDFMDSILTYRALNHKRLSWDEDFNKVYCLRFFMDFVICLVVLYLMHSFGPARLSSQVRKSSSSVATGHITTDNNTSGLNSGLKETANFSSDNVDISDKVSVQFND